MTYTMNIAGLERHLPLCKVTDDLYIAAFINKSQRFWDMSVQACFAMTERRCI